MNINSKIFPKQLQAFLGKIIGHFKTLNVPSSSHDFFWNKVLTKETDIVTELFLVNQNCFGLGFVPKVEKTNILNTNMPNKTMAKNNKSPPKVE